MSQTQTPAEAPSAFVSRLHVMREKQRQRFETLREIQASCWALADDRLPPLPLIQKIGSNTAQHFREIMVQQFSELYQRFNLSPESRVLDIGSGSGRLAFPFAALLGGSGRYYGIDVWPEGIGWCADHLGRANATFHCLDAPNNYYFDDMKAGVRNDFAFPFIPDRGLDLVFAISVFTHLVEHDARAYLREIARTLDTRGCAYLTAFVIDDWFHDFVARTGAHRAVKEVGPGHFQAYAGQDFFGGFTPGLWSRMAADAGLRIVSNELGTWAEKPGGRTYQDIMVLTRA